MEFDKVRQLLGIGESDEVRLHVLQLRHLDKAPLRHRDLMPCKPTQSYRCGAAASLPEDSLAFFSAILLWTSRSPLDGSTLLCVKAQSLPFSHLPFRYLEHFCT